MSGARAQLTALDGLRKQTETELDDYARTLEPLEVAPFQALRALNEQELRREDEQLSSLF